MVGLEEMDSLVDLDSLDRKVTEDTLAPLDPPLLLIDPSLWRKENQEPLVSMVFLASLDPEVTRVYLVFPVVRVCPDSLVLQSRVKDSLEFLGFLGGLEVLATLDQREKLESWDSLERLDHGVTMVHQVLMGILEKLVVLGAKVRLETLLDILEVQELKVSLEMPDSQVAEALMAFLETMVFQVLQVSLEQREPLVKQGVLG